MKSVHHNAVTIRPNSSVTLQGYVDKVVPYHTTCALIQATPKSRIPVDLDIVPSIINYKYPCNNIIPVQIDNITTRTVTIAPKAILCELQPVSIEESKGINSNKDSELRDQYLIDETLRESDKQKLSNLLDTYSDVFSTSDTDIGHTTIVQHKIELTDETPFKQKTRRIPYNMYEEVKNHLQQLLDTNLIRKSKSPWASNVVLCRKKDKSLRMCIDYRELNNRTKKDAYALPRTDDILEALSNNKFFTILDMKSGYHQIEVYEKHKEQTAFTVGPFGFS